MPIRNTPLLPRPWPWRVTGRGADHSMCSWQSPNACLVRIFPFPQIIAPSSTRQREAFSHAERSLPSNNTTASEGGPPSRPGRTTAGSSHTIPLRYSSPAAGRLPPIPNSRTIVDQRTHPHPPVRLTRLLIVQLLFWKTSPTADPLLARRRPADPPGPKALATPTRSPAGRH